MTKIERIYIGIALAISAVFLALMIVGCTPGLDGARQALSAAERVQTQTIHAFEEYDKEHQQALVDAAETAEAGKKALLDYRIKRGKLVQVVLDSAAVTSVGATLIPLVERGAKKDKDLTAWLSDLLAAGLKMRQALAAFGVPGGAP